jgi:hypothetical protein
MIRNYAVDIASKMNVQLSNVTIIEGRQLDCLDAHELKLEADGKQISVLLYQSELDELLSNSVSVWLEQRIRSAMSRLQTLSAS